MNNPQKSYHVPPAPDHDPVEPNLKFRLDLIWLGLLCLGVLFCVKPEFTDLSYGILLGSWLLTLWMLWKIAPLNHECRRRKILYPLYLAGLVIYGFLFGHGTMGMIALIVLGHIIHYCYFVLAKNFTMPNKPAPKILLDKSTTQHDQ